MNYTKSTACKLYEAKYSNGFNAFITEPSGDNNGTVKVFYLEGTDAPTISSTDISDYATASTTNASQIVITAEDGTTTATYDVTIEAVTPYSGTEVQFDGTESWIKSGGKYTETTVSNETTREYYAWVINRQLRDSENRDTDTRVAAGRTRIYFFVDNAESVTLINDKGTALSSDRNIKVYVNGELQDAPTSMPKYNAENPASITITTGAPAMIEISSNQNGGDTGWGKMTVTPKTSATVTVTVTSVGYATFSSDKNLDFTNSGIKAYTATISGNQVFFTRIYQVPAGTGVLLWAAGGATEDIPVIDSAPTVSENAFKVAQNDMDKSDLDDEGTAYILGNHSDYGIGFYQPAEGFTLPAGKCYLRVSDGEARIFLPGMEATGIGATLVNNEGVKNEIFNLNGQRINKLQKGLNIVNGKKVMVK